MTELGEIPNEWKIQYIDNVAKRYSGHTPNKQKEQYWNGNIPWISLKDTKKLDNRYIENTEDYTTELGIENSSAVKLPKGTVVLSRDATVGKVGITKLEPMATSQHFINYVCGENINNLYLYYYLFSKKKLFERIAIGSTIKTIGLSFFKDFKIALPTKEEQEKIASILSTIDDQIYITERLMREKQKLKEGLMQKFLQKGIKNKELKKTELGDIPKSWRVLKLKDLGKTYSGLTNKSKENFGQGKAYIPYKNIFMNSKVDEKYLEYVEILDGEKQNKVKVGDIFFTTSSETPEEAGMSSVLLNDIGELYLNSFCFGFRLNDFNTLNPKFAEYLLRGNLVRKYISQRAQGSTRYNISKNTILDMKLPIPPIEEQEKIYSILRTLDQKIKQYQNKKEKLEILKTGLMQNLLKGKIRIY